MPGIDYLALVEAFRRNLEIDLPPVLAAHTPEPLAPVLRFYRGRRLVEKVLADDVAVVQVYATTKSVTDDRQACHTNDIVTVVCELDLRDEDDEVASTRILEYARPFEETIQAIIAAGKVKRDAPGTRYVRRGDAEFLDVEQRGTAYFTGVRVETLSLVFWT